MAVTLPVTALRLQLNIYNIILKKRLPDFKGAHLLINVSINQPFNLFLLFSCILPQRGQGQVHILAGLGGIIDRLEFIVV